MKFTIIISLLSFFYKTLSFGLRQTQENLVMTNNTQIKEINKVDNIVKNKHNKKNSAYMRNSLVSTLVELPISYSTGISYYYPYFYKAHLISFIDDSNIFFNPIHSNVTCDNGCELCDYKNQSKCLKCSSSLFLNDDTCVEYCPEGKITDILRSRCMLSSQTSNIDVIYNMAYSIGSCKNMCGKMVEDCSCSPSCKRRGNCCTDYDVVNCDYIIDKSSKIGLNKCAEAGCELCEEISNKDIKKFLKDSDDNNFNETGNNTIWINNASNLKNKTVDEIANNYDLNNTSNDTNKNRTALNNSNILNNQSNESSQENQLNSTFKCTQCNSTLFLHKGKCVNKCPEKYASDSMNKVCYKQLNKECQEGNENCESCDAKGVCIKCRKGNYLYDEKCLKRCPQNYRADRITWTCLEPPVFAWYWIYPSKGSCKKNCELNSNNSDCSCLNECIQEGSCCPDYDLFCREFEYPKNNEQK